MEKLYRVSALKTFFSGPLKGCQVPWSVRYPMESAVRVAADLLKATGRKTDVNGNIFAWGSVEIAPEFGGE